MTPGTVSRVGFDTAAALAVADETAPAVWASFSMGDPLAAVPWHIAADAPWDYTRAGLPVAAVLAGTRPDTSHPVRPRPLPEWAEPGADRRTPRARLRAAVRAALAGDALAAADALAVLADSPDLLPTYPAGTWVTVSEMAATE